MSTFHCTSCGRAIFRSEALLQRVTLSSFEGHRAECYAIREAIDEDSLRRYDVSLHEGWYCCRFIMMRMVQDKFGTGDDLLVYSDAVVEVADGQAPPALASRGSVVKLGKRDHDAVISAPANQDKLLVVKHGAIWCPPCRHMDVIISRLIERKALPEVRFFELDTDEEPEIAARFNNRAIPFFTFYYGGRQVKVDVRGAHCVDGGIVGAIPEQALFTFCQTLVDRLGKPDRRTA
ncbi:MAG TPA: thioredoxin family protein [Archangium sp.]|uniref:thioredoxin family protein n=1 Tax=Archangium sp. TaxID=1872627 RepID=UPI002EDA0EF9